MNYLKTNNYFYNGKSVQVTAVRGKMFPYTEDEKVDEVGFGCIFYLERKF